MTRTYSWVILIFTGGKRKRTWEGSIRMVGKPEELNKGMEGFSRGSILWRQSKTYLGDSKVIGMKER